MIFLILTIMVLAILSYCLKLSFIPWWGILIEVFLLSGSMVCATDFASQQSKALIGQLLDDPEVMTDAAVLLTLDVAMQIGFCFLSLSPRPTRCLLAIRRLLLYLPVLFVFPTLVCFLVEMIFNFPGQNFFSTSLMAASLSGITIFLSATLFKSFLPMRSLRLELIFYLNCIIALLAVVATVNGRTASIAVNDTNLPALGVIALFMCIASISGFLLYKRKLNRYSI